MYGKPSSVTLAIHEKETLVLVTMKKKIITIAVFLILILIISIRIITEYSDNKFEVAVGYRSIDLSGIGLDTVVYLSGDMTSDIEVINKITNLIKFNRWELSFDTSTGLRDSVWKTAEVTINVNDESDIYTVYLADVLSKYRFCDGSNIVIMEDTLYSVCLSVNGMVMELPSMEYGPYYSLEINIDTTDSFIIHKEFADSNRFKSENITINAVELLSRCGIELVNEEDKNIASRLYDNCREKSIKIDTINGWGGGFLYLATVNRNVNVINAINRIKYYKSIFDKDYEKRNAGKNKILYRNVVWRVK
jgi:hypothetical protein